MLHTAASIPYAFEAKPWQYSGKGAWIFVTVPDEISAEIRSYMSRMEQGWGRLPVHAKIGSSSWKTAIWWDSKHKAYLLPIKAEIRKKEAVVPGDELQVMILI